MSRRMSKNQQRLIFLVAAFALLAVFLVADPMNLAIIDQDAPVAGQFTKGDFLTLFSVFCGTVTLVMFFSTGRWRKKR